MKTLAAQIPKYGPSFDKYLPEPNPESIFPVPTNEHEISNIVLNMKNSAPGHDGISAQSNQTYNRYTWTSINLA